MKRVRELILSWGPCELSEELNTKPLKILPIEDGDGNAKAVHRGFRKASMVVIRRAVLDGKTGKPPWANAHNRDLNIIGCLCRSRKPSQDAACAEPAPDWPVRADNRDGGSS